MNPRTLPLLCCLALAIAAEARAHAPAPAVSAPATRPDVVIPGATKRVLLRAIRVDLGTFEAGVVRQVAVKKDDTFASIAKDRYGDAALAERIAALNPGVDGAKLADGAMLWLPGKRKDAFAGITHAAFAVMLGDNLMPLREDEPHRMQRDATTRIALVPIEELANTKVFHDKAFAKLPDDWAKRCYIVAAATGEDLRTPTVPKTSPASLHLRAWKLVTTETGHQLQRVDEQFVDGNFQLVDKEKAMAEPPKPKQGAAFLLLGGLLGGGLLARRRRRADATA